MKRVWPGVDRRLWMSGLNSGRWLCDCHAMEVADADSRRQRLNVAGRHLADVANPSPNASNWAGKRATGAARKAGVRAIAAHRALDESSEIIASKISLNGSNMRSSSVRRPAPALHISERRTDPSRSLGLLWQGVDATGRASVCPSGRTTLNLSSPMVSSVPSRSCPTRTPQGAWPARYRWHWR